MSAFPGRERTVIEYEGLADTGDVLNCGRFVNQTIACRLLKCARNPNSGGDRNAVITDHRFSCSSLPLPAMKRAATAHFSLRLLATKAGGSPLAFRSAATALADLLRTLSVSASRCRAIVSATLGGIASRKLPSALMHSMNIVSPRSLCRKVVTMNISELPIKGCVVLMVEGFVFVTSGNPSKLPMSRSKLSSIAGPFGSGVFSVMIDPPE
ncbi:MAG TPA: hypothetical protein VFB14_17930 [Bryobacteraceae bacterium]|nr:hypothetical protein [Bryobacteraceae bacterium]